jgi:hypothetical protein
MFDTVSINEGGFGLMHHGTHGRHRAHRTTAHGIKTGGRAEHLSSAH